MSDKKTKIAKKTTAKKPESAAETKPAKAAKAPREKKPKEELVVFALRVREDERSKIHATAGPRLATQFSRRVLVAFANEDPAAFKSVLDDARAARK